MSLIHRVGFTKRYTSFFISSHDSNSLFMWCEPKTGVEYVGQQAGSMHKFRRPIVLVEQKTSMHVTHIIRVPGSRARRGS